MHFGAICGQRFSPSDRRHSRMLLSSAISSTMPTLHVLGARCDESRSPVISPGSKQPGARRGPRPWATPHGEQHGLYDVACVQAVLLERPRRQSVGFGQRRSSTKLQKAERQFPVSG